MSADYTANHAHTVTAGAGDLAGVAKYLETVGLYVGGAGNITVTFSSGASVQFTGVPAGTLLPFAVTKVTAATATGIVALYQ